MEYTNIDTTSLKVSRLCLGTMTFGEQNTEEEAHQQLDYAVDRGINFIDTAEMYPVPRNAETCGRTESYIGTWLKKKGKRDKLIIATKITGPDVGLTHIRDPLNFSDHQISQALDKSLQRLQTDYIDLYQLHWPERKTQRFGTRYYHHDEKWENNFRQVLNGLKTLIKAGKIRHIGVSNETPWGVMSLIRIAEEEGGPRIITIQNSYNLLNRTFEYGLSEIALREKIGLMAYSPLGFGLLTGKYHRNENTAKARLTLFPNFKRYSSGNSWEATEAYLDIAQKHQLKPAQMALAYVNSRPFLTSTIIGATTFEQLKENIDSCSIKLSEQVITELEAVMELYPDPAP